MTAPTPPAATTDALAAFLAALDAQKRAADVAETRFRQEVAARTQALATARAHAYRRAHLMADLAASVRGAETREMAAAAGQALLRAQFGWSSDSAARSEVLTRFAAVALACHAAGVSDMAAVAHAAGRPDAAEAAHAASVTTATEAAHTADVTAATEAAHAASVTDTTEDGTPAAPGPQEALAAFEDWYFSTRQSAFWSLFDHYMPETPLVDF